MKEITAALPTVRSKFADRKGVPACRRILNCLFAMLVVTCFLFSGLASAQSDQAWYERFINSVGKQMFHAAWPTDTYGGIEPGNIELKPGGADVSVVVYGTSWLEGDIWTEVVAEIRDGQITNFRFGRYSPKALIPPGTTLRTFAEVLKSMNDEYERQQAQGTPQHEPLTFRPTRVSVLCLSNSTHDSIVFSLPSDGIGSQNLAPGKTLMFWRADPRDFIVSFSGVMGSAAQKTVRLKGAIQASKPSSCDGNMTYDFIVNGHRVGLSAEAWVPGTEDPFSPNVLRSQTEGKWICADGYKWTAPDDPNDTSCIANNAGLLGVTLNVEDGDLFPKIVSVRLGGAADRAGVPAGSYLLQVDGQSMQGVAIDDVVSRTRGPINTVVRIGIAVPGRDQVQVFDLRRE